MRVGRQASPAVKALLIFALLAEGQAAAQQLELSPAERQAAAEAAYDRGTQAYRGGDYAAAGGWYERANQLAPSANALIQAIRAHERARNQLRAATLAVELVTRYGERMNRHAANVERVAGTAVRLDLSCEGCTLEIDGTPEDLRSVFVTPDTEHLIRARFAGGAVQEVRVTGAPGERREVRVEPPPPEPEPTPAPVPEPEPERTTTVLDPERERPAPRRPREGGGLGAGWFVTGLILTLAATGVGVWSGLDTLDAAEQWEMMPTESGLQDGRDLELRTNLLFGAAGALGTMTLIFAIFTDWGGGE